MSLEDKASLPVFTKYYEIPLDGITYDAPESQLIDELDDKLITAVKRQLASDVPVGFFLSGGLDSSLIVAIARKIAGSGLNWYTIDLQSEHGYDGFADDLVYADQVGKCLGVNLIRVPGSTDILREFHKMVWHLDEPQSDPASLHVWNICRYARENGDVVLLGGTAGDDVFSGYRRHQALNFEKWFERVPNSIGSLSGKVISQVPSGQAAARRIRKLAKGLGKPRLQRMAEYYRWIDSLRISQLFAPRLREQICEYRPSNRLIDALASMPNEKEPLNQLLFWDMKCFLADHNLNYTDKMSMAAGVEVCVPFLDLDLVEFACKLPVDLKMRGRTTKYLLKKVAERYLPPGVIYRPKTGFGAPVQKRVCQGLLDEKVDVLKKRTAVFSPEAIEQLVQDCKRGSFNGYYSVWSALAIDSWIAQFVSQTEKGN